MEVLSLFCCLVDLGIFKFLFLEIPVFLLVWGQIRQVFLIPHAFLRRIHEFSPPKIHHFDLWSRIARFAEQAIFLRKTMIFEDSGGSQKRPLGAPCSAKKAPKVEAPS